LTAAVAAAVRAAFLLVPSP